MAKEIEMQVFSVQHVLVKGSVRVEIGLHMYVVWMQMKTKGR